VTVEIGQELPPLVVDPVDPEKMKLMAAILRDPNPIHFDADRVRQLGMGERTVNQGPSNMSYVLNMVADWAGGVDALRSADIRFLGNVFAGDRVECRGRVTDVNSERDLVTVEVEAAVGERPVLGGVVVFSVVQSRVTGASRRHSSSAIA
jgi:acyl dehydratase